MHERVGFFVSNLTLNEIWPKSFDWKCFSSDYRINKIKHVINLDFKANSLYPFINIASPTSKVRLILPLNVLIFVLTYVFMDVFILVVLT